MDQNLINKTHQNNGLKQRAMAKYFYGFLVDRTNTKYMQLGVKNPTMATKTLIQDDEVLGPDLHDVGS